MTTFNTDLEATMNGDGNEAYTENGALVYASTKSHLLDFFATGGALRNRDEVSVIKTFGLAFDENAELATKALFYFRDVRGGQGERKTFRIILKWAAENHPEAILPNIRLISEYGRWDDLVSLFNTPLETDAMNVIDIQLAVDQQAERPSLLAKWLPSENTSSKNTRRLAFKLRTHLGMSSRRYRKMLSALRARIGLVEQKISSGEWSEIDYEHIPSKAGMVYRKAFHRHDENRYTQFLADVASGEKTINAATLYPYEIVEKVLYQHDSSATLDAMWNALPDYFDGTETNGIVVADTSGSMHGRPLAVSVALAMYTAERNTGPFHNKFITFSERPTLQNVNGSSLSDKVNKLSRTHWDYNTNLEAVFDLILHTAVQREADQSELPSHLYVVSDMEFDSATGRRSHIGERLFETIDRKYQQAGYKMPFLVFWNVDSRNEQQPMSMDQRGFQMVSGCSPSIFTSLLSNKAVSAYDLMLEVLGSKRYAEIRVD